MFLLSCFVSSLIHLNVSRRQADFVTVLSNLLHIKIYKKFLLTPSVHLLLILSVSSIILSGANYELWSLQFPVVYCLVLVMHCGQTIWFFFFLEVVSYCCYSDPCLDGVISDYVLLLTFSILLIHFISLEIFSFNC